MNRDKDNFKNMNYEEIMEYLYNKEKADSKSVRKVLLSLVLIVFICYGIYFWATLC